MSIGRQMYFGHAQFYALIEKHDVIILTGRLNDVYKSLCKRPSNTPWRRKQIKLQAYITVGLQILEINFDLCQGI